jgi:hypothetical protein
VKFTRFQPHSVTGNLLATSLLARPHAAAFLFEGGLVARIAQEFGGVDLISRAMSGPSVQVTQFHYGYTDPSLPFPASCDRVSPFEIDLLLGVAERSPGRAVESIWPSEASFHQFEFWYGEWWSPFSDLPHLTWTTEGDNFTLLMESRAGPE